MRTNTRMITRTTTALALCSGIGLLMTFWLGGCSDSGGGNSNESQGGTAGTTSSTGGSSNASGGSSSTSSSTTATGPGLWATINVELFSKNETAEAHTNVQGFPKDGEPLPQYQFKQTTTSGDCKLFETVYPQCDPVCASTERCMDQGSADGKCTRLPASVGMGNLTFTGLTSAETGTAGTITIAPINNTYQAAGSSAVAYPPCAPGAEVSVAGGADPSLSFSLKTACIDPLVLTTPAEVPFEPNKAAQFTWTPPTKAGNSRVTVRIDISHHGGVKGIIMCDAPDTGSLKVDASLVTGLIGLGTAGFPVALVTRVSSASAAVGSGKATLNVQSAVETPLAVPGIVSCNESLPPCPTGQTCVSLKCQ